MKLIRVIYCVLLLLTVPGTVASQHQRYVSIHYDTDNGLPQNSVSGITFDKSGFCWFGTQMGLVRFDGTNFKVYEKNDIPGTNTSRVYDLRTDNRGNLVGVLTSGVKLEILPAADLGTFAPVVRGTIDDIFPRDGYFANEQVTQTVKKLITDQKAEEPVMGMFDVKNKLWGTVEGNAYLNLSNKLYYLQGGVYDLLGAGALPGSFTLVDSAAVIFLKGNKVKVWYKNRLLKDITTVQGTVASDPEFLAGKFSVYWCNTGTFISCNGSLHKLSFRQGLLYAEKMLDNLQVKELSSVYYHPGTGIFILGSYIHGLYVLRPVPFNTPALPKTHQDASQNFYVQAVLDEKRVFCHNIVFSRDATASYIDIRGNRWGAVTAKTPNFIYFNKDSLLCTYDFLKKERKVIANVKSWITLFHHSLYDSVLYFATTRRIGRISNNQVADLKLLELPERIVCMTEYAPGSFYIGTQKGVYRYQLQQHILRKLDFLDSVNIRTLHWEAGAERLWIGTYGNGAFLYEDEHLYAIPQLVPALSAIHSFIDDGRGAFWLTTNKGLFKVDKMELRDLARKRREQAFFYVFDRNDGLPTSEFNGGYQYPYAWFADSMLSLPSLNGLIWFHPHRTGMIYPDKKICLDMISINGVVQKNIEKNISLPVGRHVLGISVATPYFGNPANLHLQYSVENWSQGWKNVPADGTIILENLPPGVYAVTVRQKVLAQNNDTGTVVLHISIPPPFYQTAWFSILALITICLLIYLIASWRIRKWQNRSRLLEEKIRQRTAELNKTVIELKTSQEELSGSNQVKDLIISMVLHDLQSPIRFLNTLVRHLEQQYTSLPPDQQARKLSELKNSTNALYNFTSQFFAWVRSQQKQFTVTWQQVKLEEVFEEIKQLYSEVMGVEGNTLVVIPTPLTCYTDIGLLNGILRNLVDNANKNTHKGEVRLEARQRGDHIAIEISDSGMGMNEADINAFLHKTPPDYRGGLGKILIRDMLEKIEGELEIESEKGKGTIFRIILKSFDRY